MAYCTVDGTFWTDMDVMDNFTPEDKYFYLYLLTTPRSNMAGCYELSINQAAIDLGYSKDAVEHILKRFITQHKVVDYDFETKEIIIIKWHKYHWTHSDKYIVALWKKIDCIKSERFKDYLTRVLRAFEDSDDTVSIPYAYRGDTTVTVTVPVIDISEVKRDKENRGLGEEEKEREETETVVEEQEEAKLPLMTLPLIDKTEFIVTQEYVDQLQETYLAVDVMQEFRKMRQWCRDNPKKLKTKRGIKTFINTWLSKEQDRGGKYRNSGGQKRSLTFYDVGMRGMENGEIGNFEDVNADSGGISSILF